MDIRLLVYWLLAGGTHQLALQQHGRGRTVHPTEGQINS
jgi:hypothetical protein